MKIKKINKNSIFKKSNRKKKKPKYKRSNFKTKLNKILSKSIIIFIFLICMLALIMIGKYNNNYLYFKKKPKIVAISYANDLYQKQLKVNKKSAIEVGEVDEYYSYGPDDIDPVFREKNKDILNRKRGNGYWLWKPYFINKTMIEKLNYGDYLIYSDSGLLFMNSSHLLVNFLEEQKAKMWTHKLKVQEKSYTKRDAFILMDADTPYYTDTYQYAAGYMIYKKTKFSIKFIQEWLYYCQDSRIITDDPNTMGKDNYHQFRENRHDQTILSLLIKKYRQANSGSPQMSANELKNIKPIIMPHILCIYRKTYFNDYEDLKKKCKHFIKAQEYQFI